MNSITAKCTASVAYTVAPVDIIGLQGALLMVRLTAAVLYESRTFTPFSGTYPGIFPRMLQNRDGHET